MPLKSETRQVQKQILNEVYRIFQLAHHVGCEVWFSIHRRDSIASRLGMITELLLQL